MRPRCDPIVLFLPWWHILVLLDCYRFLESGVPCILSNPGSVVPSEKIPSYSWRCSKHYFQSVSWFVECDSEVMVVSGVCCQGIVPWDSMCSDEPHSPWWSICLLGDSSCPSFCVPCSMSLLRSDMCQVTWTSRRVSNLCLHQTCSNTSLHYSTIICAKHPLWHIFACCALDSRLSMIFYLLQHMLLKS
jgi:hypothetical protein